MILKRSGLKETIFMIDIFILWISYVCNYFYFLGATAFTLYKLLYFPFLLIMWMFINLNLNTCDLSAHSWIRKICFDLLIAYSLLTSSCIFTVAVLGNFKATYKIILFSLLFSFLFSLVLRVGFIKSVRLFGAQEKFQKKVIIIGADSISQRVFEYIIKNSKAGYKLVGIVANLENNNVFNFFSDQHYLGTIEQLPSILETNEIDEVIVALPLRSESQIHQVTDICEYEGARCKIVPDYYRIIKSKLILEELGNIPLICIRPEPLNSLRNRFIKRCFDICFSLSVLLILFPVFIFIAVFIKYSSPGNVFFKQKRIGANNKEFNIYKFRTMVIQNADQSDTVWTTEADPRVTGIGRFLRKTNLDELPQFWNVLIGNMTVVGPRPERKYFVDQFKEEIRSYKVRHMVKAGVTGWAQVNGWRGDTSIRKRIEHDLYYLENWSFWLDIKIILMTVFNKNKNAY